MTRVHALIHGSPTVCRLNAQRALDGLPPIVTHYTRATGAARLRRERQRNDVWTFAAQLLSGRVRMKCARCGTLQDRREPNAGPRVHGCV